MEKVLMRIREKLFMGLIEKRTDWNFMDNLENKVNKNI
jgi:hypothetical protein